jgi:hypothetical protein
MVAIANNLDTIIEPVCRMCGLSYTIMINRQDLLDWMSGCGFIQDLLPYLTAGERELLISNTCSHCFDKIFPVDNGDDE